MNLPFIILLFKRGQKWIVNGKFNFREYHYSLEYSFVMVITIQERETSSREFTL